MQQPCHLVHMYRDSNVDVDGEGQLIAPVKKKSKAKKTNKNNKTKIDDIDDLTMNIKDEKLVAPVKRKLKVTGDKKINVKEDVDDVDDKESGGKKNRSTPADQDVAKSSKESKFIQELEELNDNKSINLFIKHILKKNGFNDVSIFAEIDLNELIEFVEKDMKKNPKYYKDICPKLRFSKKNKILLEELIQKSKEKLEKEKEIAGEPETETQSIKKKFRQIYYRNIKDMIESGYYVDKTKYMQKLIERNGCYLITRPSSFGKSKMLETIAKICEGKDSKKLFKNTAIGKSSTYQWKKYPVFKFNFCMMTLYKVEDFKYDLKHYLINNCKKYNIKYGKYNDSSSIQKLFKDMMEGGVELKNGYEPKVVILIDEYDEPLYRSCESKIENEITKIIQEFYSILTSYLKSKIQMVLITGVAKLYMTKIFNNSVNNFVNITLDEKVNAICGFTNLEVITVFEDKLNEKCHELNITKDELLSTFKRQYGGYKFCKFSKETIYNPWYIIRYLGNDENMISNWQSMNMKHFINVAFMDIEIMLLAMKDPSFIADNIYLSQLNYDDKYDQLSFKSFLFHTGLLTIDKYNKETQKYTLKIPNKKAEELIKTRIRDYHLFSYSRTNNPTLLEILENRDVKVFIDCLKSNLCKWPYNNKQCESTAYHMYLCDVIQEIYQLTHELMTDESEDACEPTRKDVIVTTFKCMYISQFKYILQKLK